MNDHNVRTLPADQGYQAIARPGTVVPPYYNRFNQIKENEYFVQVLPPSSNDQQSVKPPSKPEPHPDLEKILQELWDALDAVISLGPVS